MPRPEVLAPAGDPTAMRAAIRGGADAVYFGLQAFNARARATNFDVAGLRTVMANLHAHGVKGYVTLNTLIFDHELPALEEVVRACAEAGVDAVIVQDLGTTRMVRAVAPDLPIHASTQMTCTDASSVQLAAEVGARRVVVARELSLDEIEKIREATDTELEVFVHGALCVSYSGQCLTSEAIGGRSANRGACAQACRLPYDLVVDGKVEDLGDRAHLLSPQDLESSALVPRMAELGISSLKIEGRLKGPEYVGGTTRLYRAAVDGTPGTEELRRNALLTFSRGSGPGFLKGVDHQQLVEALTCEHRGLHAGDVVGTERMRGKAWLRIRTREALQRGDGVLVEGGKAGQGERGGRVWDLMIKGTPQPRVAGGTEALLWLGPDVDLGEVARGRRVFLNSAPETDKQILADLDRAPHREALDITVQGRVGEPLQMHAKSARGLVASAVSDVPLVSAEGRALVEPVLREKLGRLGDTPYELRTLTLGLAPDATLPLSALNRARRSLVAALQESAVRRHAVTTVTTASLLEGAEFPDRKPAPAGLFILCRTLEQATAALKAGADGVYLDFLALTGLSKAVEALRADGARCVGVAPPRIRKPGEEKIDRFLHSLAPDMFLVRGLGALHDLSRAERPGNGAKAPVLVGDFSLNVTNRLSAAEVLSRRLDAFTPSFDLDASQLTALLQTPAGCFAELVIHHPMPLFHMEHCLFASLLSQGKDFRTCGRPCESHTVSLRDRVGLDNPVEADIGCRNTVFHARSQSAASAVQGAQKAGVGRFRVELVRENAEEVTKVVGVYKRLLAGQLAAADVFKELSAEKGYGVVRGSLRVL